MKVPLVILNFLARRGWWQRPHYLCADVDDEPDFEDLGPDMVLREVRAGYPKWAYLKCPRCGEMISLAISQNGQWALRVDWLHRPTIHPSVWQTGSCGAHFFVRRGRIDWC